MVFSLDTQKTNVAFRACVYVVGLVGLPGYCKVGISSDLAKRLTALSTGTPFVPYVAHSLSVAKYVLARNIEMQCHHALRNFRVNGEWFKIEPKKAWEKVRELSRHNDPKYNKHDAPKVIIDQKRFVIPKTIEECRLATIEIQKRREAKTTLPDHKAEEKEVPA